MFVLTAENMKKAEEKATENGCSYSELMIKAGTGCADVIYNESDNAKTVILCGKGRNGGDGLVIARRLWEKGCRDIFVILVNGAVTEPVCKEMYDETVRFPVNFTDMTKNEETALYHISTAGNIIESVFGIGFRGALSGNALTAVEQANKNKCAKKFAIDIPAGLSADGKCEGNVYFETDRTLTMIALKPCHVMKPSCDMCGRTDVIDIGIPEGTVSSYACDYTALTHEEAKKKICTRHYNSHKGSFGRILTICGSRNMTGCVYLCNQAAVETGAGLVTAAFPECIYDAVTTKLTEPVFMSLECNNEGRITANAKVLSKKLEECDTVAIGCGLGTDNDTRALVKFVLNNFKGRLILDADALNCTAKDPDSLRDSDADILITPHPGEMARLCRVSVNEIENDRQGCAVSFARQNGVTVLLKGANTVIADKTGNVCINTTGNPGMARGGSGDVLTGIIAGLSCQTENLFDAACTGAYVHGGAADITKEKTGILSATPSRIIEAIHDFIK